MNIDFSKITNHIPYIFEGVYVTILIALFTAFFGFIIGTLVAVSKASRFKLLRGFSNVYTDIFRGTPLILQLSLIYYALPQITDGIIDFDPLPAAIIAFSLNSGAYLSEVIRAGIEAIDRGQVEAAKALGLRPLNIVMDIIIPQAFRKILPAVMNEFITLTKESAIVSIIGIKDIMRRQQIVSGSTYTYFEPLLVAGILYYTLVKLLTIAGKYVERRLKYDQD